MISHQSDFYMSEDAFEAWLDKAKPGDTVTYLVGDLAWARWASKSGRDHISKMAGAIGYVAFSAYRHGLVELAQRRCLFPYPVVIRHKPLAEGFEYIAQKRERQVKPVSYAIGDYRRGK